MERQKKKKETSRNFHEFHESRVVTQSRSHPPSFENPTVVVIHAVPAYVSVPPYSQGITSPPDFASFGDRLHNLATFGDSPLNLASSREFRLPTTETLQHLVRKMLLSLLIFSFYAFTRIYGF